MSSNTVNILIIVDVVGALTDRSLKNNIFLVDNRKGYGSLNEGKDSLRTAVIDGDNIIWDVMSLECESFVTIKKIEFAADVCKPEMERYESSDITYWKGKIKNNCKYKSAKYKLEIEVGNKEETLVLKDGPSVVFISE